MGNSKVIFTSLNQIDILNQRVVKKDPKQNEANTYVPELIEKILQEKNCKFYKVKSDNTEVVRLIKEQISSNTAQTETAATITQLAGKTISMDSFSIISNRLLREQLSAKEKYKHLNMEIKKGSLILSYIEHENEKSFLLALIDHNDFMDEEDLTRRGGLPYEKMALKSCLITYDDNLEILKIRVTDSNIRISEYWFDGFLELEEVTSDEKNTSVAFQTIEQIFSSKLRKNHPTDYTILRNSTIQYFRSKESFKIEEFISTVIENYKPIDENVDLTEVPMAIARVTEKGSFDAHFNIKHDVIKSRIKKTIQINSSIDLKINDFVEQLENVIHSAVTEEGNKVIIIKTNNDEAFRMFNYKK